MRFAVTAILVVIAVFGFFVGYGVCSYLLTQVSSSLIPHAGLLGSDSTIFIDEVTLISSAFGIICAFILVMIIVVFVLDTLSDEPEMYWRE